MGIRAGLVNSMWPYRVVRIGLGLVFVAAGGIKLSDPKTFARVLSEWNLVSEGLLPVAAVGLPGLEFLAGWALVFDVRGSLETVSGMIVVFLGLLYYGILADLDIDCGCFTIDDLRGHATLWQAFYRDLGLLGTALFLFLCRISRRRSSPVYDSKVTKAERREADA